MKVIISPKRKEWQKLTQRPAVKEAELNNLVLQMFLLVLKRMGIKRYVSLPLYSIKSI
jgi:hypothetical protein